MKLILEPRYLFDASIANVAKVVADPHPTQEAPAPAAAPAHEVLFVDSHVANWQTLVAGKKQGVDVVVLNDKENGLAQVTAALEGQNNVSAVHFLAYGQPGQIELGNSIITKDTLEANAQEIASWSKHLAPGADILLWGCDVAKGTDGTNFIHELHTLTGAQVGASTDATGAATLGGNWALESTTGTIDATTPFTTDAINAYHNVLDQPLPTVTFSGTPTGVLLGNSFSETVSFTNAAASGVGYGPFIDLFVPTDSAQTATLNSATYLGQTLTVTSVTLSTSVSGHSGVLGANHPLALDNTGHALFVQAPTGYVAGDTLYVITLPFGSYTPGEPAADVTLNFTTANTSELSSSHGNAPLKITAEGGFQYGADALNNPATDPSIRGTGASASLTDAADGAQTANSLINLIDVSATTDLREGETATGPDYPFHYVITLNPASATAGDAITGFHYSFTLPNEVQYTGGAISLGGGSAASGTAAFHPGASAPGGSVTVDFSSLSSTGGATTISIPVFVPQKDANGANILNPITGASHTVNNASFSYSGHWNPVVGSLDHNGALQTFSGDNTTNPSSTSFVAKSLAIQVGESGTVRPGQTATYTVNFEVSDYFDLNHLNIRSLLSDGLSLLAPGDSGYVAPTLSITRQGVTTSGISFTDASSLTSFTFTAPIGSGLNNQTVAESGSNSFWNYSRDDTSATATPGDTTVNFAVGSLLANQFGAGVGEVLQGGSGATQGTITFKAKRLDWYTNTFSQGSVRENDPTSNTITLSGTNAAVVNLSGSTITPTGSSVSDNSAISDRVANGGLQLSIVAVNGIATSGTPSIKPGDNVTYAMTYNLTTGDYGNLTLSSYLPLPVFKATDPNANGSSVASYSADAIDPFPTVGNYKLVSIPAGGSVISDATDATANSISFNFGSLNNTANTGGQAVVYFTVKASNQPYADGLKLTNQANSNYTSASTTVQSLAAIQQVTLNEPELAVKTGIVSVVADNGTSAKGAYAVDPNNGTNGVTWTTTEDTHPATYFRPAATVGLPFIVTPPNDDDLNVRGVDALDTARIVSTVQNQGHSTAYDISLKGALPSGYSTGDITNFQVVDSTGAALAYTGSIANYFSATGIQLTNGLATGQKAYVVYDLTVHGTQSLGTTLTASSSIINWANFVGGVVAGAGFVSGSTPLGESANALTDNAIITTSSPSLAKTVIAASDTLASGSPQPIALPSVTLGETVQYQVVLTVPEGSLTNGASHVTVQDVLPTGMSLVSVDSITLGSGVTSSGGTSSSVSGQIITFDLGTSLTNSNADSNGTVTILYTATVNRTNTPSAGHNYTNNANLRYSGSNISAGRVTVTEVDPNIQETITAVDTTTHVAPAGGVVLSNEDLTYTVTFKNTGNAPANSVLDYIKIPTGLTYVPGSLLYVSGGTGGSADDSTLATTGLKTALTALGAGQTATFTFRVTVDPNQAAHTSLTVQTPNDGVSGTYNSLPVSVGVGHTYTDSGSNTLTTGQYTAALSMVDESNHTSPIVAQTNTQTTANATVGEVVRMHAYVSIPEGANPTTLNFTLANGLQYLSDGTATIALVSPNGAMTSSVAALSGLTAYQDGNSGGINYIRPITSTTTASDVATFAPTDLLPGSVVDTSVANHVSINLGTLTENSNSTIANYVIIEFNAVVSNIISNTNSTPLTNSFVVTNGGLGVATSNTTTLTVVEPNVTISKTATAIDSSTGTVTYSVTLTNTGTAAAYNVTLDDPTVANEQNIHFISASGPGVVTDSTTGSDLHDVITSLTAGQSETIIYSVQVAAPLTGVTADVASVTWASLPGSSSFHGSSVGSNDNATGLRDFNAGSNPPNSYEHTVTNNLGTATGRVWQDLGSDQSHYNPGTDTALGGLTVTATVGGITQTTTTAADGTYSFGLLPDGAVTITVSTPAGDTLIYNPHQNGGSASQAIAQVASNSSGGGSPADFAFQAPDTPPAISTWNNGTAQTYVSGASGLVLSNTGAAAISDAQLDLLITGGDATVTDYRNSVLTVERYTSLGGSAAPNATDVFVGDGSGSSNLVLSGGNVTFSGVTLGSFTQSGGVLSITFGAGTQKADIANVLNHLEYSNSSSISTAASIVIGATLYDGNEAGGHNYQGTEPHTPHSLDNTSAPAFATLNLQPATATIATYVEPNNADAYSASVVVNDTVVVSSGSYVGAVVQISANYHSEDVLTVDTSGTSLSAIYSGGSLSITGAGTAADYQQVLRSVHYTDTSDTPNTSQRHFLITTTNAALTTDTIGSAKVNVVADNDSPILSATSGAVIASEDAAAPVGAVGQTVQSLVGGLITDPDGSTTGIAITAVQTSFTIGGQTVTGNWFYSTDNGAHWNAIAIPAGSVLDLNADANTRIYFQPTTANFNGGSLPNALSFRAWDGTNGVANGSVVTLPGAPGTGLSSTGAADADNSSYSAQVDTLAITVSAINDAPVASGISSLDPILNNNLNPAGDTVAHLFSGNFSDTADQQQTVANATGSVANTLAGIAIVGDHADASQGAWQYSTDNGATWTNVPLSASDHAAVVLAADAKLRFVPVDSFSGTPGGLDVRVIDSSAGPVASATGVDVTTHGGTTAISDTTVPLSTLLNPATIATYVEPNNADAYSASVVVNDTVVVSSGSYVGAVVQISANYHSEDVLTVDTSGTSLSAIYSGGSLSITGAGTAADYQQVLRSVHYTDTSDTPNTSQRSLTFTTTNAALTTNTVGSARVNVVADNDSPILSATSGAVIASEDAAAPVGAVGQTVQSLVGGLISDPDGPTTGIAITDVQTSFTIGGQTVTGNWFYSTDNGAHWNAIAIPAGSVLDLNADANTRIYFQPTTANFNGGSLPNALSFRAWDGTNGVANGSVVTLPGAPGTGLSSTGATDADNSSYSAQVDTLAITVTAINDAPVASGISSLDPILNNNLNPAGDTVAHLFSGNFSDTADQQQTVANATGSVANTLAGIAIVGDHADASQGAWQYSTDNGATWTNVPLSASDHAAIVLAADAKLRFVPVDSFSGTPGGLDVRVIDSSAGPVASATGVDVTTHGGTTAISDDTVALNTLVNKASVVHNLTDDKNGSAGYGFSGTDGQPELFLLGSAGSHFVIAEQHSIVPVPPNLFHDTDSNQTLSYDAKLPGGGALPSWLHFDAQSLTFTGTPPSNARGDTVNIVISARDRVGNEALAEFRIHVGHEQEKLMAMLKSPNGQIPLPLLLASNTHGKKHGAGEHQFAKLAPVNPFELANLAPASGSADPFGQDCLTNPTNGPFLPNIGWTAFSDQLAFAVRSQRLQLAAQYFIDTSLTTPHFSPENLPGLMPAAGQ